MSKRDTGTFFKPSDHNGHDERPDRGRRHHGLMVPWGTSTMSDEEFWGQVRLTAQLHDEGRLETRSGVRNGGLVSRSTSKSSAD